MSTHHDEASASAAIELNQNRTVLLQQGGRSYEVHCRRVLPEDWAAYFGAIVVGARRDGKDMVKTLDVQTPRLVLADRVIEGAHGYKVAGGAELTSLDGWQQMLPLAHRLKVAEILASARAEPSTGDDLIYPEGEPVRLSCIWSEKDVGMALVTGLVHVLKYPTEKQHRRYMREASRTLILGGKRTGETLYPGAQTVIAELYDELVVSVDGYTVNGVLLEGREEIAKWMDIHHKVMAAQQIFQPRDVAFAEVEDAKEEEVE